MNNDQACEWDLRFTLPELKWKSAVKKIIKHADQQCEQRDPVFLMLSGVELGKITPRAKGVNYHVHAGLILSEPCTRDDAISFFVDDDDDDHIVQRYCVERKKNYCYLGWKIHHYKAQTKEHCDNKYTGPWLIEHGTLPDDEPTCINRASILRVCKKYDPDQLQTIKEQLDQWDIQRKQRTVKHRIDPEELKRRKRERERVYNAQPDAKSKKRARDTRRQLKDYQAKRSKLQSEDPTSFKAAALHMEIKKMETFQFLVEELKRQNIPLVQEMEMETDSD